MSLQDMLMPGERIVSECKPFYATSRRIMRYDEKEGGGPAEIAYHQLTGVDIIRKPSHPMILFGTLCILATIFLTVTGLIFITSVLALIAGAVLIGFGFRGKLGYYQLHIQKSSRPTSQESEPDLMTSVRALMESLGLMTPNEEARRRLDYPRAGSFIATIRNITGELPGM